MFKMKSSGIKWIGDIPDNWTIKKIKYLKNNEKNSFVDGDWIDSEYIEDKGIRYYTTGNVGDGIFKEQGYGFISNETFKKLKCKYMYPGDLIFSRLNAPYGRSCILPNKEKKCIIAVDNVVLRTDENKQYLCYVTQTDGYHESVEDYSNGSTMQRISRTNLGNVFLPVPTLKEQTMIANFLDEKVGNIDLIIAALNKQVDLLNKYKIQLTNEIVTKGIKKNEELKKSNVIWIGDIPQSWDIKRMRYLISEIKVGPFGSSLSGDDIKSSGEYWIYNQRTVLDKNFCDCNSYTDYEKYKDLKSFEVKSGDILLTTRGTIGKVAIVPENPPQGILHPCLIRFKVNEKMIKKELIDYIFNYSTIITDQLFYKSNSTTIDVIYSYNLKDIYLPIIPMVEQKEIIDYLKEKYKQIDKILEEKNKQIEEMAKYRKSVIYEYVTGKKRVKGAEEVYG